MCQNWYHMDEISLVINRPSFSSSNQNLLLFDSSQSLPKTTSSFVQNGNKMKWKATCHDLITTFGAKQNQMVQLSLDALFPHFPQPNYFFGQRLCLSVQCAPCIPSFTCLIELWIDETLRLILFFFFTNSFILLDLSVSKLT